MRLGNSRSDTVNLALASMAIVAVTGAFRFFLHVSNPTIAALSYLLVILLTAASSRLWVAIAASALADVCLNYFFMPPVGTFVIADPQNWVALVAFLAVSLVASNLSAVARARAEVALERAKLFEERKSAELARQSEALMSALLASLAHDLRTPLTAIRVAASNLQAPWLADDDRREQSGIVLSQGERLTRLFENILDMARIDAGAIATTRQWTRPSEIIDAARAHVEYLLCDRVVEIEDESTAMVQVDPRLTSAALSHLLANAAQYSSDTPITVRVEATPEGLVVSVRDRGPGVSPDDLPRVFDRFFRGANAGLAPGTGMGLAIARGLLAAGHGRIWAENCPDGGARFTIIVPAETRAVEAVPAP